MNEKVLTLKNQMDALIGHLEVAAHPLSFEVISILKKMLLTLSSSDSPDFGLLKDQARGLSRVALEDHEFSNSELGQEIFRLTAKIREL